MILKKKAIRETRSKRREIKNFRNITSFDESVKIEDEIDTELINIKPFEDIDDETFI